MTREEQGSAPHSWNTDPVSRVEEGVAELVVVEAKGCLGPAWQSRCQGTLTSDHRGTTSSIGFVVLERVAQYLGCCLISFATRTFLRCSSETEMTSSKIAVAIKADLHRLFCFSMCSAYISASRCSYGKETRIRVLVKVQPCVKNLQ